MNSKKPKENLNQNFKNTNHGDHREFGESKKSGKQPDFLCALCVLCGASF